MFQSSDIEPMLRNLHFTKSLKLDNIYKLWIIEEHPCFIFVACVKAEICTPTLKNKNFSYFVQNHSGVTKLIHCIYEW